MADGQQTDGALYPRAEKELSKKHAPSVGLLSERRWLVKPEFHKN